MAGEYNVSPEDIFVITPTAVDGDIFSQVKILSNAMYHQIIFKDADKKNSVTLRPPIKEVYVDGVEIPIEQLPSDYEVYNLLNFKSDDKDIEHISQWSNAQILFDSSKTTMPLLLQNSLAMEKLTSLRVLSFELSDKTCKELLAKKFIDSLTSLRLIFIKASFLEKEKCGEFPTNQMTPPKGWTCFARDDYWCGKE